MNVYEHMLTLLQRYHTSADGERLAGEMMIEGFNVVGDFLRLKVGHPWQWSQRMADFYRTTDAFVYELLVWHHKPSRIAWRARVADEIAQLFPDGADILCLGDGIGYDSLSLALRCPLARVSSFELPGNSSSFAAKLIDDANLSAQITALDDLKTLSALKFDVVLSFHVLEHVPSPVQMIDDIASYLRSGGYAFISDAFTVVEPNHPTHLASNLAYAGRTIAMFEAHGMAFQRMLPNWICMFKKGAHGDPLNHLTVKAKYRLAGILARKRFARDYPNGTTDLTQVVWGGPPIFQANIHNRMCTPRSGREVYI